MSGADPQTAYRLTPNGVPLILDHVLGRDSEWMIRFQRLSDERTEDFSTGGPWTISYAIAAHVGDTPAKSGTLTVSDADDGEATLSLAAADFAGLTWDLGEALQVLWLEISVDDTVSIRPCFDGTSRSQFQVRVHRNTA